MAIFQRGETYQHTRKFRQDGIPVDIDTATMKIVYPCETSVATEFTMDRLDVGVYQGNWSIPTDAPFGEYSIEITATSETTISKFQSNLILLPWNLITSLRQVSGLKEENDIDNDDLAMIIWNTYLEIRNDIFLLHNNERVIPTSSHLIDGTNKTFYVHENIMTDYTVCDEEIIEGFYVDCNGCRQSITCTVIDSLSGEVELTQEDGSPLSSNICKVYVTYKTQSKSFTEQLFKKAITYYATHEVILRLHELDKATAADLHSNKETILANPNRMLNHYKRIKSVIAVCKYAGV